MKNLQSYDEFVKTNRVRTNYTLNKILWCFLATGPAVALGIKGGMFVEIEYKSCIIITAIILTLASVHFLLCKKRSNSKITSIFALLSLNLLIVYMANAHLGIYLTYCLVPVLSLLYCDRKIFLLASGFNYIAMGVGAFMVSPFFSSHSTLYPEATIWFINIFGGYTIEAIIMFLAGAALCKFSTEHLKKLYENQNELQDRETQISDQLDILKSMSEVYQTLNLVDLEHGMVSAMNELNKVEKFSIDKGTRSWSNRKILETILLEHKKPFADFTDLSTLHDRIKGKKSITLEVQDSISGWLRCQYISLGENPDGTIDKVVYTVENVVEEKRREEKLIRISNTDELTGLYNRRSYENDIKKYADTEPENDFVIFSIDINGLKQVNDNMGHDAGDDLIQGASTCLLKIFGSIGKVYRVGGDEFAVLLHQSEDSPRLKADLIKEAEKWHGKIVNKLNFSVGYACKCDYPAITFKDLERRADLMMYQDKELFYSKRGVDRRGIQVAYSTLCFSYVKILKFDLRSETFNIIKMNENEQTESAGYSTNIFTWFENFATSGFVHSDNLQNFLNSTTKEFLLNYFAKEIPSTEIRSLKILYQRKYGEEFHKTLMEIYTITGKLNPSELYLYVKNIDV